MTTDVSETPTVLPSVPCAAAPNRSPLMLPFLVKFGLPAATFIMACWDLFLLALMLTLMPKNDFGRTFLSAVAFVHGQDMYAMNESIPWPIEDTQINLWNLNPPHFHLLLLPLAWLSNSVAKWAWMAFNFACFYVALKMMFAEVRIAWTPLRRRLALLGMLAFIGFGTALVTGHMSFPMFLVLTFAWREARHGRWTRSAVALALALSVKPFLLMLAPYYVWRRQWRSVAALVGTVGLCYLIGVVVFGVDNSRSWLERLRLAEGWAWLPMNASLMGLLSRSLAANLIYANYGMSPQTIKMIWLTLCIPLGALSFIAVAPDTSRRGVDRAFGLLLVGALLMSPLGWTYYFLLALGPVLALVVSSARDAAAGDPPRRTWRKRLLALSLVGFLMPFPGTYLGQPAAIFSALFGSAYFWSLLFVWLALVIDGLRSYRCRSALSA